MANTPDDNSPFYEYLVDDPEQMMASTPVSPHFSPNMFGGAFDVRDRPHHATGPGNQPMPSPGHHRPSASASTSADHVHVAAYEPAATTAIQAASIAAGPVPVPVPVPGLATVPVQAQPVLGLQLHHSALLTGAEGQGHLQHHHQFGAPFADHQGPPALLHAQAQGPQQPPAPWFPPGYGAPLYRGSQQQQQQQQQQQHHHQQLLQHQLQQHELQLQLQLQHQLQQQPADATSASSTLAGPPVTISAAGGLSSSSSSTALFDFGFAAPPPPPGEQSFLGGDYADITPLSTAAAAAVTAHPQPTTTFDFQSSPWRPRLRDSSSVTLTPNIAAVAAAELDHDARKHSKGSMMADDSDVKEPSWGDDDDNEYQDRRRPGSGSGSGSGSRGGGGGGAAGGVGSSTSPRPRRQQRKGKRRAAADTGAGAGALEDDDEPTSPAGRTSVSGRSNKSASAASTTGSSSKTAPAPRLRSASRTSKNASQKPAETAEERRTRASHNLVEKQYRNRLNAQFEGLLNALPEQVRGTGAGGGGGGAADGEESDPQPADQERRVSKAEVLDMARRHIKSLERERDELQRERGGLLRNLEMMEREMAATGGGRLDEFLDVEGPPDERGESWRNA